MNSGFGSYWGKTRIIDGSEVKPLAVRVLMSESMIESLCFLGGKVGSPPPALDHWIGKPASLWNDAPETCSIEEDMKAARFVPAPKGDDMPNGGFFDHMFDQTLRQMQTSLPWSVRYSNDFRSNPQSHKDFTHALLHVGKALGHLQGLADDMDHDRAKADDPTLRDQYGKYLADLVICAMRASNTFPGGVIDLQKRTEDRIKEKNAPPVKTPEVTINFSAQGAKEAVDQIRECSEKLKARSAESLERNRKLQNLFEQARRSIQRFLFKLGYEPTVIVLGQKEKALLGYGLSQKEGMSMITLFGLPVRWMDVPSIIQARKIRVDDWPKGVA